MKASSLSDQQLYRWTNAYNRYTSPTTLRTDRGHELARRGASIALSNLNRYFPGRWTESESGRIVINMEG